MSAEEEVAEHSRHAQDPFDKTVAGTMAIIAASLAVVSVLGQHYNTEKLLSQQRASDQWAYYQAKDIRHYIAQSAGDVLGNMKAGPAAVQKYVNDSDRYKKQTADIQREALEFEKERPNGARSRLLPLRRSLSGIGDRAFFAINSYQAQTAVCRCHCGNAGRSGDQRLRMGSVRAYWSCLECACAKASRFFSLIESPI